MCETIEKGKLITRSENGRSISIDNSKNCEIGMVEVDDCLITGTSKRCDWMVRIPVTKKLSKGIAAVKLVELKGSDIAKAFSQLEATMIHPAVAADRPLINECFIVSKVSPSFTGTIQNQKVLFLQKFNVPVKVGKNAQIDAENP